MSTCSSPNDLLQCVSSNNFYHHYKSKINSENLFINLRNAATSWGTESKQYKEVHKMVYAHLAEMQAQGLKTDLSGVRAQQLQEADDLSAAFQKLDLELKTQEAEAEAGEKMEQ